MIKISPFTPLFFSPSTDVFGAESKYVQIFAPADNIFIEVFSTALDEVEGAIVNQVTKASTPIEFNKIVLEDGVFVYYATVKGLPNGYYTAIISGKESEMFKITDNERELEETTLIKYTMRSNKQRRDCVFWNGEEQFFFEFRAPGGFKDDDWAFSVNNEQFEISNGNIVELFAIESTQKKFTLGNSIGCPVWYAEHLNRILCCSNVTFNGTRFVRKGNSVPEMTQEVVAKKSYIFKVSLQGMVDNVDVELPSGEESGGSEGGAGGEGYIYLIKLNDETIPTDRNTFSSLRILFEIEQAIKKNNEKIDDSYLSKIKPDSTDYLLKLLGGAEVGEAIDSFISGKGTILDKHGRIQTDRLEVRNSLKVLELIINRIQGMENDFVFAPTRKVVKVEKVDDTTYKLTLDPLREGDLIPFREGNILYSIVNDLLTGGNSYYTSYMRVLTTNQNEYSITVSLYPDAEVPGGKNYLPAEGYNVSRRGDVHLPEEGQSNPDAQSWYISSSEGRLLFLQNVVKPVLEDYNYALSVGKFPRVQAVEDIGLPEDAVGVMAETIVAQHIYQYDYNGDVIPSVVDRGQWSLETAQSKDKPYRNITVETLRPDGTKYTLLEQHAAWRWGCKWGCLVDKTTEEPRWNAQTWAMLEGNGNYALDFDSSEGWQFFRGKVDTVVSLIVTYGTEDITERLMKAPGTEVEWLRDSGNVPSDNGWKPTYVDGDKSKLRLNNTDMPTGWGYEIRKVKFVCRIYVPDGDSPIVTNEFGMKI